MKTVFSKKEGVKMNSSLDFGTCETIKDEFEYLMDTTETMWDIDFRYFYRITDDNYIQLAQRQDGSQLAISAQFVRRYEDFKSNITFILREHIEAHLPYDGFPSFIDSSVLSKAEFEAMIQSIKDEKHRQATMANAKQTPLIDFLKKNNLYPEPTGNNSHSWVARCPSGGKHFIMVVTKDDKWGCGYCKRKGGLEELKKWIQENKIKKDQQMLTRFMKESKSGELSEEIKKWWMNRY
jgi:hypothetical protein